MKYPKLIVCDGVDQSGKTSRIQKIINSNPDRFHYFRSNYQINSKFCNKKIDLEESLKHDWRILHDFITQTGDTDKIYFIDRSFLTSYVYGKVIRKTSMPRQLITYLKMFAPFTEFWIFTNESDSTDDHVKQYINDINKEFIKLYNYICRKGYDTKSFVRTKSNKFTVPDFTNIDEELKTGRFDSQEYKKTALEIIRVVETTKKKLVISDFDGTLVTSDYPKTEDFLYKSEIHTKLYNEYKGQILLLITGRDTLSPAQVQTVKDQYHFMDVYVVWNNWNIGQSSRALKEYFVQLLKSYNTGYIFLDDREDVMKHLFRSYDFDNDLGIFIKHEA